MAKKRNKKKVARKVAPQPDEDDPIHIGIYDSVGLRTKILQTSRDALQLVQKIDDIEQIRDQKREAFKDFDALIDDIKGDIKILRQHLPIELAHVKPKRTTITKVAQPKVAEPRSHHLTDLERELAEIESKLDSMSN